MANGEVCVQHIRLRIATAWITSPRSLLEDRAEQTFRVSLIKVGFYIQSPVTGSRG